MRRRKKEKKEKRRKRREGRKKEKRISNNKSILIKTKDRVINIYWSFSLTRRERGKDDFSYGADGMSGECKEIEEKKREREKDED